MVVLGRKYKFTKFEKIRLKKRKFKMSVIRYTDKEPKEVLDALKHMLSKKTFKLIVLNTKAKVDKYR